MKRGKKKVVIVLSAILCIVAVAICNLLSVKKYNNQSGLSAEMLRELTYERLDDEDAKIDGCPNVEFIAFFERDLNNDGYADKLEGTCKRINDKDTLYAELKVQSGGYLENGKITLNAKNFTWTTSIVSDNIVEGDYIGKTSVINLKNKLNSGSQKLFWGTIEPEIGNNINNYSWKNGDSEECINSITLTGTYVADNDASERKEIKKTINLKVDWYGETKTEVNKYYYSENNYEQYQNQKKDLDLETLVDGENIKVNFEVAVSERSKELILEKQVARIKIPDLNGHQALTAKSTDENVTSDYNEEEKLLTITRTAQIDEQGNITSTVARSNLNHIEVTYPLEAYTGVNSNSISLNIPIEAFNYGYNNKEKEFGDGKYVSSAKGIIALAYAEPSGDVWIVNSHVGKRVYDDVTKKNKYEVSKQAPTNLYEGNIYEDEEDKYTVEWEIATGKRGNIVNKFMLEEEKKDEADDEGKLSKASADEDGEEDAEDVSSDASDQFLNTSGDYEDMEKYIKTTGIYFENASNFLGENGWIKLYTANGDTPMETFTSSNWGNYTENSPYKVNLQSIKIETSKPQTNQVLNIYQIKEIDDDLLTKEYTEEKFNELSYICTYLKGTATIGEQTTEKEEVAESSEGATNNVESVIYTDSKANYDMPYSEAELYVNPDNITNVRAKEVTFTISANSSNFLEQKWTNGEFLIELPESILNVAIKEVKSSNNDVDIKSYYTYEKDGKQFMKISTENEEEATFDITIKADVTANPLETTKNLTLKLYAYNSNWNYYIQNADDKYDIDSDGITEDKVGYDTEMLSMIAPSGLLTTEFVTDYDDNTDSKTIAPNIADIDKSTEEKTATINVSVTNNYEGTISNIAILGKIPFTGNKYSMVEQDLNSKFTASMEAAINVPEQLRKDITVYYTTAENPQVKEEDNKFIDWNSVVEQGNWIAENQVKDWSQIRTYLILFNNYVLGDAENIIFNYKVKVPGNIENNKASFSNHMIYYNIDMGDADYPTKTEPEKVGIQVVSKYDLKLTKSQKGKESVKVAGATYSVTTEDVDGKQITKTAVTDKDGVLHLTGLYAEREYTLKEIASPEDYAISEEEIKFSTKINEQEELELEGVSEEFKEVLEVAKGEDGNYFVKVSVEDEAKYTLEISKKDEKGQALADVSFTIRGKGKNTTVKTNADGKLSIKGLYVGEEYELKETRSDGYYVDQEARKFKVQRKDGNELEIVTDDKELESATIKEPEEMQGSEQTEETKKLVQAVVSVEISNKKIPTYDLKIIKVKEDNKVQDVEKMEKITTSDTTFTVLRSNTEKTEECTTKDGEVTIKGLYAYVDEEKYKYIDGKCIIQEIKAPDGYSNNAEQIELKVTKNADGTLGAEVTNKDKLQTYKDVKVKENIVELVIQDKPLFKLTKKDSETNNVLPNAKFVIFELNDDGHEVGYAKDVNDNFVGEQDEYGQWIVTTDENGEISLPLKPGTYKAVEVGYPEGYQENINEQIFKVAGNGESDEIEDEEVEKPEVDSSNVLEIKTAEDLRNFSNKVNNGDNYSGKTVRLENDIDLSDKNFTPIGSKSHPFSGTFDGRGTDGKVHEIRNLNINSNVSEAHSGVGLFGVVDGGHIKNVGVTGKVSHDSSSSEVYVGGIVGSLTGENCSIENCYNTGTITSTNGSGKHAGGIVGRIECSDDSTIIRNCYNIGDVNCDCMGSAYAGGIVGSYRSYISINNCNNKGNISSSINDRDHGGYAAGIACNGLGGTPISITECYNLGNISSKGNTDMHISGILAGGIVDIEDSYNMGNVNHEGINSSSGSVGGILSDGSGKITGCYNTGDIGCNCIVVGGIAGSGTYSISNCYNSGNVRGSGSYAGGIAGMCNKGSISNDSSISNCYNTGEVSCICDSGNGKYAGGIVGTSQSSISNCYNIGDVCSSSNGSNVIAGGIVASGNSTINKCYYSDKIEITGTTIDDHGEKVSDDKMKDIRTSDSETEPKEFYNKLNDDGDDISAWEYRVNRYPVIASHIPPDLRAGTELEVKNTIKKLNITTEVKDDKGGDITGKGETPFKIVEYNKSYDEDTEGYKEIEMTPENDYGIVSVTINGKEISYQEEDGGKYSISSDYFKNIKEDKHVVVTYAKLDHILTIKKVDDEKKPLAGAKFKIEKSNTELNSGGGAEGSELNGDDQVDDNSEADNKMTLYITNEKGEIKVALENGTYTVTEVEAPKGYTLDTKPQTVTIGEEKKDNVLTFTNKKQPKITVHHYLIDNEGKHTENKVAPDQIYQDDLGKPYAVGPRVDLEDLIPEKDADGNYVKPENATGVYEDKVIDINYYYQAKPINLTIHHYMDGTENKLEDDEVVKVNANVEFESDYKYKVTTDSSYTLQTNENYKKLLKDYDLSAITTTIKENTNINDILNYTEDSEITYYYKTKVYTITTNVVEHKEKYSDGHTENVKGGTISGETINQNADNIDGKNLKPYESVVKGHNSEKDIVITPNKGYEIFSIKITEEGVTKELNVDSFIDNDGEGTITLNADNGFFNNVTSDKYIEVEFRKKTKVIVRYFDKETGKRVSNEIKDVIIEGLEGSQCNTERKMITNYRKAEVELEDGSTASATFGNPQNGISTYKLYKEKDGTEGEGDTATMFADDIAVIYWYEKIPEGKVVVRHIEINEEDIRNGLTMNSGTELKVEVDSMEDLINKAKAKIEEDKKLKENTQSSDDSATNNDAEDTTKETKGESIQATSNVADENTESGEQTDTDSDSQGTENTEGGQSTISKEEVEGSPEDTSRGETGDETDKETENDEPQDNSNIAQTVDNENGKSTKEEYKGLVETTKETSRRTFIDKETGRKYVSIDGPESSENIIVVGKDNDEYIATIVENSEDNTIEIRYYYIRQYHITTEVKQHEEVVDGVKRMVKGGSISGEGTGVYEIINRMGANSKQITVTPEEKYQVKSITVNGKIINMENLIDENRALRLDEGYFTEIAEDKHVVVEYEKRPGRVVVKFLEEGTGKELSEEFEINGITDDEYKVYPKAIEGYEVVKDKYPQNEKGNITPGDTVVVYYYSAIQEKPDVTPQNPDTVPEKTENPDVTPPSSDTVQENPDMEPEIPADQPNAQDENLYPELYDTSNGTTGVQTGDKVIFSIITMIVAGAVIFIMNIGKRKIGKHENKN